MKPKSPTQRPLDDGRRDGTEPWRTIEGVEFCHWDRWLLRLALTEPGGLDTITRQFKERARRRFNSVDAVEAMVAQIVDLQRRLALLARTPATVLDDEEKGSEWLFQKAWRRVWRSGPQHRTRAMRETPRWRLSQRALRGHTSSFPVSPAGYEQPLLQIVGPYPYIEYFLTGTVAYLLETEVERLAARATTLAERLAIHRAAMTVIIETMDRVDDSLAQMATAYENIERAYLDALREFPERGELLRDLLELATWEDYGLTTGVEAFLASLAEE